jgi:hypothetical protein
MSNALAIAAVTATLRHLLDHELNADLPGTKVTTRPPDRTREDLSVKQVNLFLYQTLPNAAWRNTGLSAAAAQPPLALNLYYLLWAHGQEEEEAGPSSHRLLGQAMRILHDHPVLDPAAIRAALPGNDLDEQPERVRITLQPLALDELLKLWTAFQAPYRLSVSYEASVVLIESSAPRTAAHE